MGADGPFVWWAAHLDLMALCQVISFIASGIAIFLKNARGSSVAVAFLSSLLFTSLGIPFLSIQYAWQWPTLSVVSAGIGFGSLTLSYTAMRIAEILQKRAEKGAAVFGGDKAPPLDEREMRMGEEGGKL